LNIELYNTQPLFDQNGRFTTTNKRSLLKNKQIYKHNLYNEQQINIVNNKRKRKQII
jgi:hypothetical protein